MIVILNGTTSRNPDDYISSTIGALRHQHDRHVLSYFFYFHKSNFQLTVTSANNERLELLVLSSVEFENTDWTDGKKEFERDGKMFDVARIEIKGDKYFVYCENDSLEDLLIAYCKTSGYKTKINLSLQGQIFEPVREITFDNIYCLLEEPESIAINLYHSVTSELNTPPPKIS